MAIVQVENLLFDFSATVVAEKYDDSTHYRQVWSRSAGGKAVDVVAVENGTPSVTWLVEAKDFRIIIIQSPPRRANITDLPLTVAAKANDTLVGLADAAVNATDPVEKSIATSALAAGTKRIVLHLEPHTGPHTALFPLGFPASVLQRLRQLVQAIDSNPLVLNISNTPTSGVPWTVT